MKMGRMKYLASLAAVAATQYVLVGNTMAAITSTWNYNGSAAWSTSANWNNGVPNCMAGDKAILQSGTATWSGGDFHAQGAGSLTLDGGSFTTTGWTRVSYGGNIVINNGTYSAYALIIGDYRATSGATVRLAGGNLTITGQIGFSGTSTIIISSGMLTTRYSAFAFNQNQDGNTAVSSLSFTDGSTGTIRLLSDTTGNNARSLLNSGRVQYNGVVVNANSEYFTITTDADGSYIQAVPEAASLTMLAVSAFGLLMRRGKR